MLPSGPHIPVVFYQAYEVTHLTFIIWWRHFYYIVYFLSIGWIPSRIIQNLRYYILGFPKNNILILHLSLLFLIFYSVN